jgi:hypothetical protein
MPRVTHYVLQACGLPAGRAWRQHGESGDCCPHKLLPALFLSEGSVTVHQGTVVGRGWALKHPPERSHLGLM